MAIVLFKLISHIAGWRSSLHVLRLPQSCAQRSLSDAKVRDAWRSESSNVYRPPDRMAHVDASASPRKISTVSRILLPHVPEVAAEVPEVAAEVPEVAAEVPEVAAFTHKPQTNQTYRPMRRQDGRAPWDVIRDTFHLNTRRTRLLIHDEEGTAWKPSGRNWNPKITINRG